jgi:hypothetical protein
VNALLGVFWEGRFPDQPENERTFL